MQNINDHFNFNCLSYPRCQIQGFINNMQHVLNTNVSNSLSAENFANRLAVLTDLAAKHPALRDSYLLKSQTAAHKFDIITDAAQVQRHLEELKNLMNEVENQLKSVKKGKLTIHEPIIMYLIEN